MQQDKAPPLSKGARERLMVHRTDQRYTTARTAIRAGAAIGALYVLAGALESFAGQDTNLSIGLTLTLQALLELKFIIALSFGGMGVVYGLAERWLRHRKVENMQARIRQLETSIDPGRSTSGLTPRGKTNPQDKRR
jgi:hypothetical protein